MQRRVCRPRMFCFNHMNSEETPRVVTGRQQLPSKMTVLTFYRASHESHVFFHISPTRFHVGARGGRGSCLLPPRSHVASVAAAALSLSGFLHREPWRVTDLRFTLHSNIQVKLCADTQKSELSCTDAEDNDSLKYKHGSNTLHDSHPPSVTIVDTGLVPVLRSLLEIMQ